MILFVQGLEFMGPHGVYDEERRDGRRFEADVEVEMAEVAATRSDALTQTLDYRALAAIVVEVGRDGPSRHLIERLAGEMVDRVMEAHAGIVRARVTLRKFATGVPGDPHCVGITLERRRDQTARQP